MDDGRGVYFNKVYQGACSKAIIQNLSSSITYTFYVKGTNFNGEGITSANASFRSCVNPSGVVAPYLVSTNETKVKLRWSQPTNDGGCPITSFAILSDMGGATYSTDLEASSVENKAYLFEHEFTFTATETGKSLGFKLKATNAMGSTTSESYLKVLVASSPPTPTLMTTSVSTNSTFIEV
jgi:hypothetical protein